MPLSWWQIPGPERYIRIVTRDVRDGRNVILCLPSGVSKSITSAIRQSLISEESCISILPLDSPTKEDNPLDILFERFAPNAPNDIIRTSFSLCDQESFRGKIIMLGGISEECWPAWKTFLQEYEVACRAFSPLQRSIFIVPLFGLTAKNPPLKEVLLAVHRYNGYIERNDMLLYATTLYSFRSADPVKRQLCTSICAELAQWDPELCERLVRLDLMGLIEPESILQKIAEERGWLSISNAEDREHLWANGVLQEIEGQDVFHSSFLAIQSRKRELNQRLWRAELSVLYPLIEQKRQYLIQELLTSLRLPHVSPHGEKIDNPLDLEIRHIYAQLRSNSDVNLRKYRRQVARLREMRNALAHVKPVEKELLMDMSYL